MRYFSAGSYVYEEDASLYAESVVRTVVALAHTFNKGVIGTPGLIVNEEELKKYYGTPINNTAACQGWFAAREYLRRGNWCYINRVESTGLNVAAYCAMSLPTTTDDYLVTENDGVTDAPNPGTLTSAGSNFTTAGTLVGDVLEINDVSDPGNNGFYVITVVAPAGDNTKITVDRAFPAGVLAALTFTVWSAKREAGADGVTSVPTTRTLTSALSTFTINGVVAGDILRIHDSTVGATGDNGLYRIVNVAPTILTVDRDWPIGSLAALDFTVYSSSSRGADGSTATPGEFNAASAFFGLHGVKAGDVLVICDAVDTGNNGTYLISGLGAAALAQTRLYVNEQTWSGGVLAGLTYYVLPGAVTLTGESKGTWCRRYRLYPTVNAGDSQNVDISIYNDGTTLQDKIGNVDRSNIVTETTTQTELVTAALITGRGEPCPGFGTVSTALGIYLAMSGGNDGYTSIADSDYILGLNAYLNPEKYEIDLLICPGVSTENVTNRLAAICEARQDTMFLADPPDWTTIDSRQEIVDFHNGVGATVLGATARSSSFGALYWTWQEVYDEYNDVDRWIAPSGHMAGVYAYNDKVTYPWFAPAGIKRGKLIGSKDVRYSPDQDDREVLYGPGQAVNPIVQFVDEGNSIYCYGQKTLQRTTTALNRINVRRMLIWVKRAVRKVNRALVFDPNDEVMWREFKLRIDPLLDYVKTNRGMVEYRLIADASTTTPTEIENYRMVGKVFVKPTLSAEGIYVGFILTSQGANFTELVM